MTDIPWWSSLGLLLIAAAGMPPNPKREAPPAGLEGRAKKAGDEAPAFSLADAQGGTFELRQALQRGPVAIVFYRGFW